MARPPGHRRSTLSDKLDREVHQVVRKIVDEKTQYGGDSRLSFAAVYDDIKRSNSSLNRRPKRQLEDSIERVIEVMNQDAASSESEDGVPVISPPKQSNGLNRSIVAMWPKGTTNPAREDAVDSEPVKQALVETVSGEPSRKKRKRTAPAIEHNPPTHVSLEDLGGVDEVIDEFFNLLHVPFKRPQWLVEDSLQPLRGILIHGPPGCGKTTIANAVAAELKVNFISVSAPSIVSGMSGESEKALREHFEEAKRAAPAILFIDEIDAIATKRDSAQREMEKRIVAQLATCMDDLDLEKTDGKPVIVIAATNRPDSLDAGLRRGGRFDKEINMSVPNESMRESILRAVTRKTKISSDVDLKYLARKTPGFVGADLRDLLSTATNIAMRRLLEFDRAAAAASEDAATNASAMEIDPETTTVTSSRLAAWRRTFAFADSHQDTTKPATGLTQADFLLALPKISPSALREGFATVPTTTFDSIGAHSSLITELQNTLIGPILNPEQVRPSLAS